MNKFRSLLCGLILCLGGAANAAGTFDGIYSMSVGNTPIGFVTVQQNGTTVVAVLISTDSAGNPSSWEAFIGGISGSAATMVTVVSGVTASFSVTFSANATGLVATQLSCTAKTTSCAFTNGTKIVGVKIF